MVYPIRMCRNSMPELAGRRYLQYLQLDVVPLTDPCALTGVDGTRTEVDVSSANAVFFKAVSNQGDSLKVAALKLAFLLLTPGLSSGREATFIQRVYNRTAVPDQLHPCPSNCCSQQLKFPLLAQVIFPPRAKTILDQHLR